MSLSVSHIRDEKGTVLGLVGIAEDITEQKQAEEAQVLIPVAWHGLGERKPPRSRASRTDRGSLDRPF